MTSEVWFAKLIRINFLDCSVSFNEELGTLFLVFLSQQIVQAKIFISNVIASIIILKSGYGVQNISRLEAGPVGYAAGFDYFDLQSTWLLEGLNAQWFSIMRQKFDDNELAITALLDRVDGSDVFASASFSFNYIADLGWAFFEWEEYWQGCDELLFAFFDFSCSFNSLILALQFVDIGSCLFVDLFYLLLDLLLLHHLVLH